MSGETVITAYNPKPPGQGRISYGRGGRGYHSNGKQLKPWRKAVADAAALDHKGGPIIGPVDVEITVTVPLTGVARTEFRRTGTCWPVTRYSGDVDHLARAILDALTGTVYCDDSQVVELTVRKVYPDQGIDALAQPGALIRVRPFEVTA